MSPAGVSIGYRQVLSRIDRTNKEINVSTYLSGIPGLVTGTQYLFLNLYSPRLTAPLNQLATDFFF